MMCTQTNKAIPTYICSVFTYIYDIHLTWYTFPEDIKSESNLNNTRIVLSFERQGEECEELVRTGA